MRLNPTARFIVRKTIFYTKFMPSKIATIPTFPEGMWLLAVIGYNWEKVSHSLFLEQEEAHL